MVTALAGITNVVVALIAFANTTPSGVVQLSNTWPAGGVPAIMVTVVPAEKFPPPVPFFTVTA